MKLGDVFASVLFGAIFLSIVGIIVVVFCVNSTVTAEIVWMLAINQPWLTFWIIVFGFFGGIGFNVWVHPSSN